MRTEELIRKISQESKDNARFEELKTGLPLGDDMGGNVVLAQKRGKPMTVRNTCVTGKGKTSFIRRLLITLSCLYDRDEACFFVISPHVEYGELLRLSAGDFTVPYIRSREDVELAKRTLKELLRIRESNAISCCSSSAVKPASAQRSAANTRSRCSRSNAIPFCVRETSITRRSSGEGRRQT